MLSSLGWRKSKPTANEKSKWAQLSETISRPDVKRLLSACALVSCIGTLCATKAYARYFRRIPSSEWITPDILLKRRWVKGVVTNVGDADNFRLYHTPLLWRWFKSVPTLQKELTRQTIHIRLAGVDAPEAGHFGNSPQPYASEALDWLRQTIEGKTVYCQLISRERYGRNIAMVMVPRPWRPTFLTPWFGKCVSLEMLSAGWAVTYEQLGSEYGKWGKEIFLETEALAKAQRVGQWVNGTDVETPAEYKRRHARSLSKSPSIPDAVVDEDLDIVEEESDIVEEYEIAVEPKTRTTRSRRKSWWKRLFEPGNRKR